MFFVFARFCMFFLSFLLGFACCLKFELGFAVCLYRSLGFAGNVLAFARFRLFFPSCFVSFCLFVDCF